MTDININNAQSAPEPEEKKIDPKMKIAELVIKISGAIIFFRMFFKFLSEN